MKLDDRVLVIRDSLAVALIHSVSCSWISAARDVKGGFLNEFATNLECMRICGLDFSHLTRQYGATNNRFLRTVSWNTRGDFQYVHVNTCTRDLRNAVRV